MSCVIVPIEIKEGSDIKEVCKDVHDFASQMDCNVKFTFEGIEMEVSIWQLPDEIEKEWYNRKKWKDADNQIAKMERVIDGEKIIGSK